VLDVQPSRRTSANETSLSTSLSDPLGTLESGRSELAVPEPHAANNARPNILTRRMTKG